MELRTASELPQPVELAGDKAGRIVEAMRTTVAARGIAGATFDQVAREAGVSRGLLHYYFGTKERLLVEAVRREFELRHERLELAIADADTVEAVLDALVHSLQEFLEDGSNSAVMVHEMITVAQRNEEIAAELKEMASRNRAHVADYLAAKDEAGVLNLRDDPEAVASFLYVLGDGITVRRLSEPEFEIQPLMDKAVAAARALLT